MKYLLLTALLAAAPTPLIAADVGVSISIGQPGFYGRIELGDYPRPQLIYAQPRYVYRAAAMREPIYLHVPPGHAKNWRKYCRHYNACGERVYFVQNTWYEREYVPRYQQQHRDNRDGPRGDNRGDDRRGDDRRGDNRDDRHDNDRGHGR